MKSRVLPSLVVWATAVCIHQSPSAMTGQSPLIPVVTAEAPHPSVADKLAAFAALIGSWDVDIVYHDSQGDRHVTGEWHFGWGLEGRALVDVWIAPARPLRRGPMPVSGEWGMTVRFYDPSIDAWRSTWHGPKNGVLMPFVGRLVNGEIVLEGSFQPGEVTRWVFSDITPETFRWRAATSRDNWKTETLQQEMSARRQQVPVEAAIDLEGNGAAGAATSDGRTARPLELITAPSPLGLRPPAPGRIPGTRRMPVALIAAGLLDSVPVTRRVDLPEPAYDADIDPGSGIRNLPALVEFTRELDRAVTAAVHAARLPVILGGDCSVLLGPAVALRRRGRYALVHLDGHSDFGHEGNTGRPYASVAGADLAVVTGRGPAALANIDNLGPYFRDADVFQLGEKDGNAGSFADLARTAIHRYPLSRLRRQGVPAALQQLLAELDQTPAMGFWLHVDLDVLDPVALPAVDSPDDGGLGWQEFDETLAALIRHPKLAGMNIGIYDPDLDPDGAYARRIAALLRQHLLSLARGQ